MTPSPMRADSHRPVSASAPSSRARPPAAAARPITPTTRPSTPTSIGVRPCAARSSATAAAADVPSASSPDSRAAVPTAISCHPARATTPRPVTVSTVSGRPGSPTVRAASSTTGRASGWSDPASASAAHRSTSSRSAVPRGTTSVTRGRPVVRVPVLSRATVSIRAAVSRNSPPLTRMPSRAARPIPATTATGIEMTSAPGQLMTSSVRASVTSRVTSPTTRARAIAPGVYQRLKRSRNRCVGACASCASSTRRMMRARVVSAPTPVADTRSIPPREIVPAKTRSPTCFSTGMDSPVIDASSRTPCPPTTSPSTGTFAPSRTTTVSPGRTSAAGTSTVDVPRTTTARSGATATSSVSADRVRFRVAASSAWPRAKRKVTAAASQYSPTTTAPTAATVTSRSMPTVRAPSARTAASAMRDPATTAAATISTSRTCGGAPVLDAANAARISTPATTTAHRPPTHPLTRRISSTPPGPDSRGVRRPR